MAAAVVVAALCWHKGDATDLANDGSYCPKWMPQQPTPGVLAARLVHCWRQAAQRPPELQQGLAAAKNAAFRQGGGTLGTAATAAVLPGLEGQGLWGSVGAERRQQPLQHVSDPQLVRGCEWGSVLSA